MKLSHPKKAGVMQASKWLTHRALLDTAEMQSLLDSLPHFNIYNVSELVTMQEARISIEDFLAKYIDYVTNLKAGVPVEEAPFKPTFSCAFSSDPTALYAMKAKEGLYIIKPIKPVVQLSFHHFLFSPEHCQFHSMVHSKHAVSWGLQFSYPQLYSNSLDGDVIEVFKNEESPNTRLFQALAKWMRKATTPVPFLLGTKKIHATFRLGEGCFNWIDAHPHLPSAGLAVARRT